MLDRYVNGVKTNGLRFVGNVTELRLTTTDELREKYSSSEASSPLLKRVVSRRTVEFTAVLDEFTMENLSLAMMGTAPSSAVQANTAVTDDDLGEVQQGRYYDLGNRNIASFVLEETGTSDAFTVGDDYTVDLVTGLLYIVPGGGIADGTEVQATYTRATETTITTIEGGAASTIEAYLHFESDNATGPNYRLKSERVSITPDGDLGFISDDFGNFTIRLAAQKTPNAPLYVLEQVS
jgi:hypothetical protein